MRMLWMRYRKRKCVGKLNLQVMPLWNDEPTTRQSRKGRDWKVERDLRAAKERN